MYIFGAPIESEGVWYLLNSWKARALRELDKIWLHLEGLLNRRLGYPKVGNIWTIVENNHKVGMSFLWPNLESQGSASLQITDQQNGFKTFPCLLSCLTGVARYRLIASTELTGILWAVQLYTQKSPLVRFRRSINTRQWVEGKTCLMNL